jgi:hypothetical protein
MTTRLAGAALLGALALGCGGDARPAVLPNTDASADATAEASVDAPSAPQDVPAPTDAPAAVCAEFALTDEGGSLRAPQLNEVSGIVESARRPGTFFVHNDSGDTARFFAVDLSGALRAEYRLADARAVDWEDIARGPCAAGTCLYLADIGDNNRTRTEYTVYRVPEPDVPDAAPASVTPVELRAEAITFRYPDGAHNAETLVADPADGALYVITKVDAGPVAVYRVGAGTATRVAEMTLPAGAGQLTGGDAHPGGRALLLRTYARVLLYERPAEAPFASLFAATPRAVAVRLEPQGEAVAWRLDGRGYVTVSEGVGVRINAFRCADGAP